MGFFKANFEAGIEKKLSKNVMEILNGNKFSEKILIAFEQLGKSLIKEAKKRGDYQNRSGGLRKSISAIIMKDNLEYKYIHDDYSTFKVLEQHKDDPTRNNPTKIMENSHSDILDELKNIDAPFKLAVYVGYWYGIYVEIKGYDVITGTVGIIDKRTEWILRRYLTKALEK